MVELMIDGKPFINKPIKITKDDVEEHNNFLKNIGIVLYSGNTTKHYKEYLEDIKRNNAIDNEQINML